MTDNNKKEKNVEFSRDLFLRDLEKVSKKLSVDDISTENIEKETPEKSDHKES